MDLDLLLAVPIDGQGLLSKYRDSNQEIISKRLVILKHLLRYDLDTRPDTARVNAYQGSPAISTVRDAAAAAGAGKPAIASP